MKELKLKTLILTMLLVSAFSFSQSSQPKAIQFDNVDGVFINLALMDSISLKLIDRGILKKENLSFAEIIKNIRSQNDQLSIKFDLSLAQTTKYKELWGIAETQKDLLFDSLEAQKLITKNIKKRAFRNGLLYFGGGVSVGLVVFALLVN